jgi:hypothetical protein
MMTISPCLWAFSQSLMLRIHEVRNRTIMKHNTCIIIEIMKRRVMGVMSVIVNESMM